ncbi:hypothetical protein EVAR_81360_1 [Eumeta japonica]|uniref:Uncharacterized protein n=1 Tax=Eumeta variegata TaxID=151549 RepID=A0A4C1XCP0_EUMVA|nr:hypothetical protein EVAR_81360_1 [Eumeta japonica]
MCLFREVTRTPPSARKYELGPRRWKAKRELFAGRTYVLEFMAAAERREKCNALYGNGHFMLMPARAQWPPPPHRPRRSPYPAAPRRRNLTGDFTRTSLRQTDGFPLLKFKFRLYFGAGCEVKDGACANRPRAVGDPHRDRVLTIEVIVLT